MQALMILGVSSSLTSCQDILGEWDKPTSTVTPPSSDTEEPSDTYRVYTATNTYTPEPIGDAPLLSGTITGNLSGGKYVVRGTATCAGNLIFTDNAELILCDGAELTVNGTIFAGEDGAGNPTYAYSLSIYGQESGTGTLTINSAGANYDLVVDKLEIHGGTITATNADQAIETGTDLIMYNGTLTTTGVYNGIEALGNMYVYGGTITASASNPTRMGIEVGSNLTINDGIITSTGGNGVDGNGEGGPGIACPTITIDGGTVTATGGNAAGDSNDDGGAGISSTTLTANGGTITAYGGTKIGAGDDGLGITGGITLSGVTMYEDDDPNPAAVAASQTTCSKRYVIIKN